MNEAKLNIHSSKWTNSMKDELNSVKDNDVWDLAELSKGKKLIGYEWVFKIKMDSKSMS